MVKIEFASALNAQIKNLESIVSAIETEIHLRKMLSAPSIPSATQLEGEILDGRNNIMNERIELAVNQRIISELESNLSAKKEWLENLKERVPVEESEREDSYNKMISEHKSVVGRGKEIKDAHDKARFEYALTEFNLWMSDTDKEDHKEASVYYYKLLVETLNMSGVPVMSIAV